MADNNFRSSRGRDQAAPRSQVDDPLAELARLIGQAEPLRDTGRGASSYDPPSDGVDWAASGDYASEEQPPAPDNEVQRYEAPRLPEPAPPYRPLPPVHEPDYELEEPEQFSAPPPKFNVPRESPRRRAVEPVRYREQPQPMQASDRQLPAFLPRRDERFQYDNEQAAPGQRTYEFDDYEEEPAGTRRRGGLIVIASVLGLAVLGTAGAFAYRAMFGASMLPSLPPIIKADDTPNKIIPSNSKSNSSAQASVDNARSGEKLVSREEQPVNVPPPANTAPRVVSTIPVFPDPNPAQSGMPSNMPSMPMSAAPVAPPPIPAPAPVAVTPPVNAAPALPAATAQALPVATPEPKKIHTVAIRPDQLGGGDNAAPVPLAAAAPAPPPPRTVQVQPPAPRPPKPAAVPPAPAPQAANAPLSIIPDQGGGSAAPPPVRPRQAMAQPAAPTPLSPAPASEAPAAATSGGGYAVQVTSQRSEAEAQAEFRILKAKYPNVLGSHEPIYRRADLGSKGVYYRALVGPFASAEQAATLCSDLKAAGGNCIVQRN